MSWALERRCLWNQEPLSFLSQGSCSKPLILSSKPQESTFPGLCVHRDLILVSVLNCSPNLPVSSALHRTPWLASKSSLWPAAPPILTHLSKHKTLPICLDPRERAQFPHTPCTMPENWGRRTVHVLRSISSRHGCSSFNKGHCWLRFRSMVSLFHHVEALQGGIK